MKKIEEQAATKPLAPRTKKSLEFLWRGQARQPLTNRLNAAAVMKAEGNDKFSEGDFKQALSEYTSALELFQYELANLVRDQQEAELGDLGRGLGSDDLTRIQKVRIPCLLNAAAANLHLGDAGLGSHHFTAALENLSGVLQAGATAAVRAKAHFREARAHLALDNVRQAWQSATLARELSPHSSEIRDLQLQLQRRLRELKKVEKSSARQGAFGVQTNQRLLAHDERRQLKQRRALLRNLLSAQQACSDEKTMRMRQQDEALLDRVASVGWANISAAEQGHFDKVWMRGRPQLSATQIKEGRAEGIFPPRDKEKVFGKNIAPAIKGTQLIGAFGWLTSSQKERVRGLAVEILNRGAEVLNDAQRRLAEAVELLFPTDARNSWHSHPLDHGGALLILSPERQHLWAFPPPRLEVLPATMGATLPAAQIRSMNARARRPLARGELGILLSNDACWKRALEHRWEWALVLEDDMQYVHGLPLQLVGLAEHLVASATVHEPEWQLIVLSGVDTDDFFGCISDPAHAPSLTRRRPGAARFPRQPLPLDGAGWNRVGPTCHAFAWIYRAPLMRRLVDAMARAQPPYNPLDIWVWEVMAEHDLLAHVLAPEQLLVSTQRAVAASSVKDAQG